MRGGEIHPGIVGDERQLHALIEPGKPGSLAHANRHCHAISCISAGSMLLDGWRRHRHRNECCASRTPGGDWAEIKGRRRRRWRRWRWWIRSVPNVLSNIALPKVDHVVGVADTVVPNYWVGNMITAYPQGLAWAPLKWAGEGLGGPAPRPARPTPPDTNTASPTISRFIMVPFVAVGPRGRVTVKVVRDALEDSWNSVIRLRKPDDSQLAKVHRINSCHQIHRQYSGH